MGRRWGKSEGGLVTDTVASSGQDCNPQGGVDVDRGAAGADSKAATPNAAMATSVSAASSTDVVTLSQSAGKSSSKGMGPFKVWWIEKLGERQFERREGTFRLDEPVPVLEKSEAVAEYRCRITAFYLRKEGWKKDKIAKKLDRAPGWVALWWEKPPAEVPRPWDVPQYVAVYNMRMLDCGIEPFRPAVLKRRFMTDTAGLYEECAQRMPWRQAVFRKRNYETGGVTVTSIPSSRQDSSYVGLTTGISRLDEALDQIRHDFNITDPRVYLLNNFYPDGNTSIAPHTHDFWSAILSFGASRIFTVDGHPMLLGDGDLLVIGTQRHAVPKMPEVQEGRVSVSIFWYPENKRDFWPALDGSGCCQCGRPKTNDDGSEALQEAKDGNLYCKPCWLAWQVEEGLDGVAEAGLDGVNAGYPDPQDFGDDHDITEEDLVAAALEMSLKDF